MTFGESFEIRVIYFKFILDCPLMSLCSDSELSLIRFLRNKSKLQWIFPCHASHNSYLSIWFHWLIVWVTSFRGFYLIKISSYKMFSHSLKGFVTFFPVEFVFFSADKLRKNILKSVECIRSNLSVEK